MPDRGNRHRLVVYSLTVDPWWRLLLSIGVVLAITAVCLDYIPYFQPARQANNIPDTTVLFIGGTAVFCLLMAFFLASIRYFAYVQPWSDHLRLVTPFLRLKISYRRIHQAVIVQFERLYPPPYKRSEQNFCHRLSGYTAIVLVLKGFPLSRFALRMFLSPYFFPDQTSRLALLVPDWIKFSNELESFRGAWIQSQQASREDPRQSLYSSIANQEWDG